MYLQFWWDPEKNCVITHSLRYVVWPFACLLHIFFKCYVISVKNVIERSTGSRNISRHRRQQTCGVFDFWFFLSPQVKLWTLHSCRPLNRRKNNWRNRALLGRRKGGRGAKWRFYLQYKTDNAFGTLINGRLKTHERIKFFVVFLAFLFFSDQRALWVKWCCDSWQFIGQIFNTFKTSISSVELKVQVWASVKF